MATGTFHKRKPIAGMVRIIRGAKTLVRRTATIITDEQSVANIHNMVNARDDVKKIQDLNRDMFRVTKELRIYHSAFSHKRELELVNNLQSWMQEINRRCDCAKYHLEVDDAIDNNLS